MIHYYKDVRPWSCPFYYKMIGNKLYPHGAEGWSNYPVSFDSIYYKIFIGDYFDGVIVEITETEAFIELL